MATNFVCKNGHIKYLETFEVKGFFNRPKSPIPARSEDDFCDICGEVMHLLIGNCYSCNCAVYQSGNFTDSDGRLFCSYRCKELYREDGLREDQTSDRGL